MLIGIDASRANTQVRTGTEWYSYFLIKAMKQLPLRAEGEASPRRVYPAPRYGVSEDTACRFILYSKTPLANGLEKLPENFEARVLRWPLKFFWTQIRLAWEMLASPPDVLFVPAHALPLFSRAKMVITIHDVGFRIFPHFYAWKDILYHRFSTWFASRFAHKIICPSEFTKSQLIKWFGADPKKIFIVPHGVQPAPSPPLPLLNLRGVDKKPSLLFIGRLEEKKNIINIVKAFELCLKNLPDLELLLVGRPGYGFERVARYIAASGLQDKIEVTGYISEEEKARLYASAAVFVFPTLYEGFGLPILEAQANHCPVVTSNQGANKEVAGPGAVLVDPRSPQAIAGAIVNVLKSQSVREKLIRLGLENCKKYAWEAAAAATLEVLRS